MIQGPNTHQARTSHYIAVDAVHDELFAPNPFADALLVYRGAVNGNEAPIRIIQGPKTLLTAPDNVAVDGTHNEVFTASFPTDSVFVYSSKANGDVAPLRVIHGPKTQLDRPIRVDVDPLNNVIAVVCDQNILFFNRTDDGDVAPKWSLGGPKLGIGGGGGSRDVRLYPEGKKIIAGANIRPNGPSAGGRGRGAGGGEDGAPAAAPGAGRGRGGASNQQHVLGVWKYGDTGDVAPWAALYNNETTNIKGSRLAINPKGGDLIVGGDGQVQVYHLPEIFAKTK
jgi:hypothetical protein